jgi:hypothetical protein
MTALISRPTARGEAAIVQGTVDLTIIGGDGTIRVWDVALGESLGVVWKWSGGGGVTPWCRAHRQADCGGPPLVTNCSHSACVRSRPTA